YGDRLSLFRRNDQCWTLAEELRGQQDPTHFGRMLRDLGIGFIAAQSPQAKGRIERLWGTLQDRLVSELRLRALHTLEQANAFLPEFLPAFIRRFGRAPAAPTSAWRPAPRALDHLLSCRYRRVVARDRAAGRPLASAAAGAPRPLLCRLSRGSARAPRRSARRLLSGHAPRGAARAHGPLCAH